MSKILVFPGQGSQYIGMLKDVYDKYGKAKEVFNKADDVLGFSLSKIIFEGNADELQETYNAQPALLTSSIAILEVLKQEYGFKVEDAKYIAGHSLGEYTALVAGQSITLEQGVDLVRKRGQLMEKAFPKGLGAMCAVIGLDILDVEKLALDISTKDDICVVANDNSVGQVVLSGTTKAIDTVLEKAKPEYKARMVVKLQTSGPFHSPLMEEAALEFKQELDKVDFKESIVPILHNFNADVSPLNEIKNILISQLSSRVRWRETILHAVKNGVTLQAEFGPSKVLTGLAKRIDKDLKTVNFEKQTDVETNVGEL